MPPLFLSVSADRALGKKRLTVNRASRVTFRKIELIRATASEELTEMLGKPRRRLCTFPIAHSTRTPQPLRRISRLAMNKSMSEALEVRKALTAHARNTNFIFLSFHPVSIVFCRSHNNIESSPRDDLS